MPAQAGISLVLPFKISAFAEITNFFYYLIWNKIILCKSQIQLPSLHG